MNVLTLNCGSSSLKLELRRLDGERSVLVTSGEVRGIGSRPSLSVDGRSVADLPPGTTIAEAVKTGLTALPEMSRIDAVAHRVVHGGPYLQAPVLLDQDAARQIEDAAAFAPLHNRPALLAIEAARQMLGPLPMVAVFDTSFHAAMPEKARRYALDWDLADRLAIRRYGFHGLAHQYMTERYASVSGRTLAGLKLITLQLGSGCSAAAVRGGVSIDTSMGFTPLEGLMMETRCGDIDPSLPGYIAEREGLSLDDVNTLLNQQSGIKGVAGARDLREVLAAEARGEARAGLALEMFVYRVQKYIGAYLMALGGAEAIVFGGGIGENSPAVRARVVEGLAWLDTRLDTAANGGARGNDARISTPSSRIDIWTVAVDEGGVLARAAAQVLDDTHSAGAGGPHD
jgi:acetate kinase